MGMKSNSNHFKGTSGLKKDIGLTRKTELRVSKYNIPNTLKTINVEKQQKHMNGDMSKSQIILSIKECNELIKKSAGKGTMINSSQEIVNFGKIIGYIKINNELYPTTWGKIHYSKTGTHIVPYYQQNKRRK